MTIGQRIKQARKAAGITQEQLADRLGISFQSVSQWERDKRSPKKETIDKIANAIGCNALDLLFDGDMGAFAKEISNISGELTTALEALRKYPGDEKTTDAIKGIIGPYMLIMDIYYGLNDEGKKRVHDALFEIADNPDYKKVKEDGE